MKKAIDAGTLLFLVQAQVLLTFGAALCFLVSALAMYAQGESRKITNTLSFNESSAVYLRGGETHWYNIRLKRDTYLQVTVDQKGIDVVLLLFAPTGQLLLRRDRPNDTQGPESLSFLASISGSYRLAIRSQSTKAKPGHYEITSITIHTPTAQDHKRIRAEILFQDGLDLTRTNTNMSIAQASAKYAAAATLWRELDDQYAEALALISLGNSLVQLNENEKAAPIFERSLYLYRALRDPKNEALTLSHLCILNSLRHKVDLVLLQYRQAKAIYRSLQDDLSVKSLTEQLSGMATDILMEGIKLANQETIQGYNDAQILDMMAAQIFQELGEPENQADALASLSNINYRLGDNQQSLQYDVEALGLYKSAHKEPAVARTLNDIGTIYDNLGDYHKAVDYYEEALPLYRKSGKPLEIATVFNNIASVSDKLNDSHKALQYYGKARSLFERIKDELNIAQTFNNLGSTYYSIGAVQTALDYYGSIAKFVGKAQ